MNVKTVAKAMQALGIAGISLGDVPFSGGFSFTV